MDLLTHLLSLVQVRGQLDVHCHFGVPWRIDEPTAGQDEMRYHVLLRGRATLEVAGSPVLQIRAGDIVAFPSGDAHILHDGSGGDPAPEVRQRGEGGILVATNQESGAGECFDILCGRFLLRRLPHNLLSDYLPRLLYVHSAPVDALSDQKLGDYVADSRLARLIELMREETLAQEPGSESLVNQLSGALFALTLRYASQVFEPSPGLLLLARQPRLQPAVAAMFERPEEQWTLPMLAALANMSRATFVRHFDEAAGTSAIEFLTGIRMAVAGRLLEESLRPIAEIGESVGYLSPAAFQRAFKKQVGVTPAQWRSAAKQG